MTSIHLRKLKPTNTSRIFLNVILLTQPLSNPNKTLKSKKERDSKHYCPESTNNVFENMNPKKKNVKPKDQSKKTNKTKQNKKTM